jgi:hypothetical protein
LQKTKAQKDVHLATQFMRALGQQGVRMINSQFLTLLGALVIISASAKAEVECGDIEYDKSYKKNLPIDNEADFIRSDILLTSTGKMKCKVSLNYRTLKSNRKTKTENGSINGVLYRTFYSDGSGSVQGLKTNTLDYVKDKYGTNWSTSCKTDEMDDSRWCALDKGDLRVGIWKDGSSFITIGNEHYPESKITIRIDKNKPISAPEKAGFTTEQSDELIAGLLSGKAVLTRYQKWPYQSNIDNLTDLYGFPEAWELLNAIYKSSAPIE